MTAEKKVLPKFGYTSEGKCRVLDYQGRGFFTLRTPTNQEVRRHRRDIQFTKEGKAA